MSSRQHGITNPTAASRKAGAVEAGQVLPVMRQLPFVVRAMRPTQWSKNALVLLAIIFARRLTDGPMLGRGLLAFAIFCLASSSVYLINDIFDRNSDRLHPVKRMRPIAAGQLSIRVAAGTAALCALAAGTLTFALCGWALRGVRDPFARWGGSPALFALAIVGYFAMNIAYSAYLKHQVLWDVFIIAAGFVLRAVAGALAAPVPISPWFYLCTMFLALFLALGKRRAELVQLSTASEIHRENLRAYTTLFLDQLMAVVVTSTLITYSLYTFQTETGSHALMITIPFVIFGMFRYLYLIYVKAEGDRPDELLWRDRQILASVVLCVVFVLAVLYVVPALQAHIHAP